MSEGHNANAELRELLAALREDAMTDAQAERLIDLLRKDSDARRTYIEYMAMVANLRAGAAGARQTPKALDDEPANHLATGVDLEAIVLAEEGHEESESTLPPIIVAPSPNIQSPLYTLQSPVGSFVFSHIAAAVILGIGLLIGLAWRISFQPFAGDGTTPTRVVNTHIPVGRITAMSDCRWFQDDLGFGIHDAQIAPAKKRRPRNVFQGDKFALASGLLEITYNTGAKVILQGPCSYQVDSVRSGYLAVGKLTAKVDKRAENTNHSPLSPLPSPLFAVRTPIATVIDLGTEFGVEVEESGVTRSHVFQGSVELRTIDSLKSTAPKTPMSILRAGESARVERNRNRKVTIIQELGQPERFVRFINKGQAGASGEQIVGRRTNQHSEITNQKTHWPHYQLVDLGTLGGLKSMAHDINAAGQVAGKSETAAGVEHAFLYDQKTMHDLGALDGITSSACGLNAEGQVVGVSFANNSTECVAFLYNGKTTKRLGTLGGKGSYAMAINCAGQVVGASLDTNGLPHAFLYDQSAGMKHLGAIEGSKASAAFAINDLGMIVGEVQLQDGQMHAFLYSSDQGLKDLGTLGGRKSYAISINNKGQLVGESDLSDGSRHAFYYNSTTGMRDLGTLGGRNSIAMKINNRGQVVGSAETVVEAGVVNHAFLYTDGMMIDLNLLVDSTKGLVLNTANSINDAGQIVGVGVTRDGNPHAVLLTPAKRTRN